MRATQICLGGLRAAGRLRHRRRLDAFSRSRDIAAYFAKVLGLELGEVVTVERTPMGVGSQIVKRYQVLGVGHNRIDAALLDRVRELDDALAEVWPLEAGRHRRRHCDGESHHRHP